MASRMSLGDGSRRSFAGSLGLHSHRSLASGKSDLEQVPLRPRFSVRPREPTLRCLAECACCHRSERVSFLTRKKALESAMYRRPLSAASQMGSADINSA